MINEVNIPKEGDLHSVVCIDTHAFELRYGYCDERDRVTGEPYILYPDLRSEPFYTNDGYRIVTALQGVCEHYLSPPGREQEDCCYTCSYYPNQRSEIGICRCEAMRKPSAKNLAVSEEPERNTPEPAPFPHLRL